MIKDEILRIFGNFCSGRLSLEQFEEWVVSHLQETLDSGDKECIALMDEADTLLMELGEGQIAESLLRNEIEAMIPATRTIEFAFPGYDSVFTIQELDPETDITGPVQPADHSLVFE
jgi:hypothetical protein